MTAGHEAETHKEEPNRGKNLMEVSRKNQKKKFLNSMEKQMIQRIKSIYPRAEDDIYCVITSKQKHFRTKKMEFNNFKVRWMFWQRKKWCHLWPKWYSNHRGAFFRCGLLNSYAYIQRIAHYNHFISNLFKLKNKKKEKLQKQRKTKKWLE